MTIRVCGRTLVLVTATRAPFGAPVLPVRSTSGLEVAHDEFLASGRAAPGVRDLVADSWRRSVDAGLDPERSVARIGLAEDDVRRLRAAHPLTAVMPVIRRLLLTDAVEAGLLVAVTDADGQLLYVEGQSRLLSAAEAMHFVPGADWSEASAGTNAPGTALALGRPVQILGAEHLARRVTPWSCSAAPVRNPATGRVIGVIDVTGGPEVATPYSLSLVRATAAAAEAELRLHQLRPERSAGQGPTPVPRPPRLEVLARVGGVLHHGSTTTRLSLRHTEMLLLLASAEDGLSAGQLAVELSDDELPPVTIRAGLSRLRSQLGALHLHSRPYRLGRTVGVDAHRVRDLVVRGELGAAVAAYVGPVLPASESPGVVRLRQDLHLSLRSALLASEDVDALLAFGGAAHGRDDREVWEHLEVCVPADSPHRGLVDARVEALRADEVVGRVPARPERAPRQAARRVSSSRSATTSWSSAGVRVAEATPSRTAR